MRRRIRLTGRKQLSRSSVELKIAEVPGKRLLSLTLAQKAQFQGFPKDSRVSVKLHENKLVEVVEFGALGALKNVAELRNDAFVAPSVQFRIAATGENTRSLLLGSTDTWTLQDEKQIQNKGTDGILLFLPGKIAPRIWKLDIREDDYPVVYVDDRIPDPRTWARTDPTFVGSALPAVMHQVFDDILQQQNPSDVDWMKDWLRWADILMPGKKPPLMGSRDEKLAWIEDLIDSFSQRHQLADALIRRLLPPGEAA